MDTLAAYYDKALPADLLSSVTLGKGNHDGRDDGVCAMELVAWLAGEPHGDKPECACPAITAYVIRLNDSGPQWLRDEIRDRTQKIVGTRSSVEVQKQRLHIFASAAVESAESVLSIFEKARPGDDRPRKAIEAAKACLKEGSNAARAADAADAARGRERAADAAYAARAAAYAARAAAYAARGRERAADAA